MAEFIRHYGHRCSDNKLYHTWYSLIINHKENEIITRWKRVDNFIKDVGNKKNHHYLTRIDKTKPYGPNNYQWVLTKPACKYMAIILSTIMISVRLVEELNHEYVCEKTGWSLIDYYNKELGDLDREDFIKFCIDLNITDYKKYLKLTDFIISRIKKKNPDDDYIKELTLENIKKFNSKQ